MRNPTYAMIALCDPINPEFGYSVRLERDGKVLLHTARHPITGKDLSYQDCIQILAMYPGDPAS